MTHPLSVILALVVLSPYAVSRSLEPGRACPACLNGGLCLPRSDGVRGARSLSAGVEAQCFCPSPWVGAACERRGFGGTPFTAGTEPGTDEVQVRLGTLRGAVQTTRTGQEEVGRPSASRAEHGTVLLVNFKLDTRADPSLRDPEAVRFAMYSVLCPSSPCPSGLVMEDIRLLALSEDSERRTDVRLAISPPPGTASNMESLKQQVGAQLLRENDMVPDAFGGLVLHSGFQLASANVVRQAGPSKKPPAASTARRFRAAARRSHAKSQRPPTPRVKFMLGNEPHETSCATWCIIVLAFLFLVTTAVNVSLERACRWFYPSELESGDTGDTDEFEQVDQQSRDFRLVRAMFEVSKVSLAPVAIKASLMFIVQARARELTRGTGLPPAWAELNMQILTVSDVLFVLLTSIQVFKHGSHRIHNVKQSLVILFANPSSFFVLCWTAITLTQAVNTVSLVYCAYTLTVGDCNLSPGIDAKVLWTGSSPPALSIEFSMCLVFIVQFLVILKIEILVLWLHLLRVNFSRNEDQAQDARMMLSNDISRYRLLSKTTNLAPLLTIITLCIREVALHSKSDIHFRTVCLYSVASVMILYSAFIACCISLPRGSRIEVDLSEGAVSLASATDYLVHHGNSPFEVLFRSVRRLLLGAGNIIAGLLIGSVFVLDSGDAFSPHAVVPWPIMWALFVLMQVVVVHMLCLLHEGIVTLNDQTNDSNSFLLSSSLKEIEGFMALAPMLCLTFLCAHSRATMVMRSGQLPQWVLTAMNTVAQTLLLQLVVTLLEASIAGALFTTQDSWAELQGKSPSRARSQLEGGPSRENSRPGGFRIESDQDPFMVAAQEPVAAGSFPIPPGDQPDDRWDPEPQLAPATQYMRGAAIEEAMRRLETEQADVSAMRASFQRRSESRASDESVLDIRYEVQFLATKFLNLFSTIWQLCLLGTLYTGMQLVFIAVWTMDRDIPRKTYTSGDWRSSVFPLLPVSAPTSTAMESMVWFIWLFFAVKLAGSCVHSLRYLYGSVRWSVLLAFHRISLLVDLVPLIVLLCFMAQSRAAAFHGVNSSPQYYVQLHMIVVVVAMGTQCLASLSTPAFTGELTKKEAKGLIIPGVRLMFLFIEGVASIAMYWGILVIIVGISVMRPEDVVLASGTIGVSWRGKGEAPPMQPIAWNMLFLCSMVFFVSGLHKITHHLIMRKRFADGVKMRGDAWFQRNKNWRVLRWHHAVTLARQVALASTMLGCLFIPLERIVHPMAGESQPQLVKEGLVSQELVSFMKMLFFVASLILTVKTFLMSCYGFLQEPRIGDVYKDSDAHAHEDGNEQEHHPVLERPVSHDFESEEGSAQASSALANAFRRFALALATCEAIVVAVLAVTVFYIISNHMGVFTTGVLLNGTIYLFGLYLLVHTGWGFLVLSGYHSKGRRRKGDGFLEAVSPCPLLLLLTVACQERVVEVAGRHGIVPVWMQHLNFVCGIIIVIEFITVALSPPRHEQVNMIAAPAEEGMASEEADFKPQKSEPENMKSRNFRVAFIVLRLFLRKALYSCLGTIIFGLFWMTEEQCLATP